MDYKELIKEAMKRFPKGSLVMSIDGEIGRIAEKEWTTPKEDDWYEGIYYWGMSHSCLCAMVDGKQVGMRLYDDGEWALRIDIDDLNNQLITIKNQDAEISELKEINKKLIVLAKKLVDTPKGVKPDMFYELI